MRFHAAIFDLDGTLLNTLEDIAGAANRVLAAYDLPVHKTDDYRHFIGDGVEMLIRRALPVVRRDSETVEMGIEMFRNTYGRYYNVHTKPYDGIPGMLDDLLARGVKLAVLSNKPDEFTKRCVGELLPARTFDFVLGQRSGMPPKPDPAGAIRVAAEIGVPPDQVLFAGDSAVDMETAVSAGMFPVGVRWGFRSQEELRDGGAQVTIADPREIVPLVDGPAEMGGTGSQRG